MLMVLEPFQELANDILSRDPIVLQILLYGILLGGVYVLAAVGLTLVFGVMEVVNFAHGAFLVLGMYAIWYATTSITSNIAVGLILTVGSLAVIGYLVYRLSLEPAIDEPETNQMVITLGVLLLLESGLAIIFGTQPKSLQLNFGSFHVWELTIPIAQLIASVVAGGILIMVYYLLTHTELGMVIRGTANSRIAAQTVGINIDRVYRLTFTLGAVMAGVAGGTIALYQGISPYSGTSLLIISFVIVVLGGLGSIPGAAIGGLIVGIAHTFGVFYGPGTTYEILIFSLFILILLLKPEGLFAER